MSFNFEALKTTAAQATTNQRLTLADMIGKTAVLPLPIGLHECTIIEVPKALTATSFRIVVEAGEDKQHYSVTLNIGNTPEQGDIFMSNISFLLEQLDMKSLDLDTLQTKVGETIMVLASSRTTERGTFVNYSFNPQVMANMLNQLAQSQASA